MRKQLTVAAAVAAALASTGAFALNEAGTAGAQITLIVSGASAQRDAFNNELKKLCNNAGATDFDTYSADDGNSATSEDFRVYSCTLDSNADNANVPVGIQNQTVAVYYRSEGGSVYGVGPLLSTNPTFATGVKRILVNTATPCSNPGVTGSHTCPIVGYSLTSDSDATSPSRLDTEPTDLGISDVEPKQFTGANWPVFGTSVLGNAPTPAQLSSLNSSAQATTGTVFGILVSNSGPTAGLTNISREAVSSIFSGVVTDWGSVDDGAGNALAAGPITVCRREPGSGTQVAASIYFTGTGCSSAPLTFLADPAAIENSTSTQMNTCVAQSGAIGFRNVGSNPTGAHFVQLDGQDATKKNAALGRYQFNFEATSQKRTGLAGTKLTLANTLISFAQKQAALNTALNDSTFALPTFNAPATFAKANSTQPVALGLRNKSSCKSQLQLN